MDALPLLRLLQLTDSSFPVGGYAYSHGLEWLIAERRVAGESDLAALLEAFVAQNVRRQWLPAAALAYRARSAAQRRFIDERLDASIAANAEREAGRAMGRRLLAVADAAGFGGAGLASDLGIGPAQYAVAFAGLSRAVGISEAAVLGALGYSALTSLTQAAVRLGTIGPEAAARLIASQSAALSTAVAAVVQERLPRIGAFAPKVELAAMLQPTLKFRMFAS